ncbi:HU domain-containing protein [Flavobacterium silvaticum]|uniref:SPOR domain-containing protein n=1 Tax=Flavobacterium silvaticum TaxID=1852020 RepID=A0A972JFU5_9FLAO|nr:SPOR domain-containing protein [Flavobacterium silvaticum]NMH28349.1 SPOR domain-containing protein [Flavobacterium silvaticum]
MKIEHYISRLLYRYQCVTVPGFGAFLTEFQSAQIQESSNAFYPPKKRISFNPHLKNNDGLLANHISESEKTAYDDAVVAIQNEVSIWKDILKVNGRFTLKNIGELSLNAEQSVVFSPSDNINYHTESFGLSSFVSPKIKREVYKEEVRVLEESVPVVFTPEARERKNSPSWLKYAAVFVLAFSATGGIGYTLFQKQVEQQTLLVNEQVQEQVQNKIQEATFFIENPLPAVTLTVKENKLPYHIVAGVFRNESNADNACQDLKKLGYPARRIGKNKHGLFPVLYGSYPDAETAKNAMTEIRSTRDKQAWLMVKDL